MRAAFAPVLLAAALIAQAPTEKSPAAETPTVRFGPMDYRPEGISIQAGQTVRFTNSSDFTHTVSDLPKPAQKDTGSEIGDQLPAGEQPFDSGEIEPQQSWEHKFNTKGTYRFHCREHEMDRMSGTIIVN
jgi:plastocyanin